MLGRPDWLGDGAGDALAAAERAGVEDAAALEAEFVGSGGEGSTPAARSRARFSVADGSNRCGGCSAGSGERAEAGPVVPDAPLPAAVREPPA